MRDEILRNPRVNSSYAPKKKTYTSKAVNSANKNKVLNDDAACTGGDEVVELTCTHVLKSERAPSVRNKVFRKQQASKSNH